MSDDSEKDLKKSPKEILNLIKKGASGSNQNQQEGQHNYYIKLLDVKLSNRIWWLNVFLVALTIVLVGLTLVLIFQP